MNAPLFDLLVHFLLRGYCSHVVRAGSEEVLKVDFVTVRSSHLSLVGYWQVCGRRKSENRIMKAGGCLLGLCSCLLGLCLLA